MSHVVENQLERCEVQFGGGGGRGPGEERARKTILVVRVKSIFTSVMA